MNSSVLVAEPIVSIVGIQQARNVRLRQGNRTGMSSARMSRGHRLSQKRSIVGLQWKASDPGRRTFAGEFDLHQTAADDGRQDDDVRLSTLSLTSAPPVDGRGLLISRALETAGSVSVS
jgi:hypothetical protein